jgi:hypothetical protein
MRISYINRIFLILEKLTGVIVKLILQTICIKSLLRSIDKGLMKLRA